MRRRDVLLLCFFLPAIFFLPGCGKRRPPLPPLERIPQRTEELSATQQGNQILLEWPAPRRNASDQSVQSIRRVDVYRLAEALTAPLPLTEDEFAARSTLVGSVTLDPLHPPTDEMTYTDPLELQGQNTRLRYAIRFVNASNQRAAFSNFVLIEPSARIARPPSVNAPTQTTQESISLTWEPPAANIDNSTPVNILGYNIYRATADHPEFDKLNPTPVNTSAYSDRNFVFGENYRYAVRTVSLGTGATQVESLDSNIASFKPVDTFAPPTPRPVSAVAAPGRISLFFPASPASDLAGYEIFRSTDPSLPLAQWQKLTAQLYQRTTFIDDSVESGKKYFYYVTAVDTNGNRSAPSEPANDTAP